MAGNLLPYEDALARILDVAPAAKIETVSIANAAGRTLAQDVTALLTHPPFAASAMDGWAVRAQDLAAQPLTQIGISKAGEGFDGTVGQGQCVRIFTGAPVPAGADAVIMQEHAAVVDDQITFTKTVEAGRNIRAAGGDFIEGDLGLEAGRILSPHDVALAAAMNHATLAVARRPVVAILSTGDELVPPGTRPGPHQIIASNAIGLAALVEHWGGIPRDLGLLPDDPAAITQAVKKAEGADILITIGGASVGDHDHVQDALKAAGAEIDFWRVAIKPGKPLMFGTVHQAPLLGLPGNPVSALVVAHLFLRPLLLKMLGADPATHLGEAICTEDLAENGVRRDHIRAHIADGKITPLPVQDSAHLSVLARANALLVRPAHAPALQARQSVPYIKI